MRGGGGMKKRAKAISKPAKAGPRKALERTGRSAPRAKPGRDSLPAGQTKVAKLTNELNEAREQQAATSRCCNSSALLQES
jgi:hypothetical protein